MSAREELTAVLAAVRMSEERRRGIESLIERALNEAADGNGGVSRINAAFLRGYAEGAKYVENAMFESINDAASTMRATGRLRAREAHDALTTHMSEHGHQSGINTEVARAITSERR